MDSTSTNRNAPAPSAPRVAESRDVWTWMIEPVLAAYGGRSRRWPGEVAPTTACRPDAPTLPAWSDPHVPPVPR